MAFYMPHWTADAQVVGTGAYSAVTVTTTSAVISSTAPVNFLDLVNLSPTATVCINFGSAVATISGTQCSAGEIALPPGWHRSWEGTFIPGDTINAIASATAPFTLGRK
jgi:hypothetical protein